MKTKYILLVALTFSSLVLLSCSEVSPDSGKEKDKEEKKEIEKVVEIKDEGSVITDITFKQYCYDRFDLNKDGKIDADEAKKVLNISITNNTGIVSVQGIEIFSNIQDFEANQCSNLRDANLYYNKKLAYVGFANCTGLISVTLPESIKAISSMGFYNCPGLTTINLPSGITSIGDNAFAFCSGLSTLVIPGSVVSIGDFAFKSCTNLTSISLAEGITTIGEQAFYNCKGLNKIVLPSTITKIGDVVCVSCTGLQLFYCKAINPPIIGGEAFMGCTKLSSIIVPGESVAKYIVASGWRPYSSKIVGSTVF